MKVFFICLKQIKRFKPPDGGVACLRIHCISTCGQLSTIKTAQKQCFFSPKAIDYILFLLETRNIYNNPNNPVNPVNLFFYKNRIQSFFILRKGSIIIYIFGQDLHDFEDLFLPEANEKGLSPLTVEAIIMPTFGIHPFFFSPKAIWFCQFLLETDKKEISSQSCKSCLILNENKRIHSSICYSSTYPATVLRKVCRSLKTGSSCSRILRSKVPTRSSSKP